VAREQCVVVQLWREKGGNGHFFYLGSWTRCGQHGFVELGSMKFASRLCSLSQQRSNIRVLLS
jgi:hypothetical protein